MKPGLQRLTVTVTVTPGPCGRARSSCVKFVQWRREAGPAAAGDPVQVADPSMPGGQAAHGMGAVSGERMERAIKHTYVCGTDEWFAEEVFVLR